MSRGVRTYCFTRGFGRGGGLPAELCCAVFLVSCIPARLLISRTTHVYVGVLGLDLGFSRANLRSEAGVIHASSVSGWLDRYVPRKLQCRNNSVIFVEYG